MYARKVSDGKCILYYLHPSRHFLQFCKKVSKLDKKKLCYFQILHYLCIVETEIREQ